MTAIREIPTVMSGAKEGTHVDRREMGREALRVRRLEVEDPAHRRPVAEVPRGSAEDVARAVNAAADAFPAWSRHNPA